MNVNLSDKRFQKNELIYSLLTDLKSSEDSLSLMNSNIYYDFPVFKDLDEEVIVAQFLLISESHGMIIFYVIDCVNEADLSAAAEAIEKYFPNHLRFVRILICTFVRQ